MQEKCQNDKIALVVVLSLVRTAGIMENIQCYPDTIRREQILYRYCYISMTILLTDKYYIS